MVSILHPDDASLLCSVKDKQIPFPYLDYDFFKEAFPDWLSTREPEKDLSFQPKPKDIVIEPQKKVISEEQKAKMAAGRAASIAKKQAERELANSKL